MSLQPTSINERVQVGHHIEYDLHVKSKSKFPLDVNLDNVMRDSLHAWYQAYMFAS